MRYHGLTGRIILPDDAQYNCARQVYNEAINKYPCVIVYCYQPQDVANAVLWSRKNGVPLRIRSGGHNYEGYSIGNDTLVIDTTFLNAVTVNCHDDTVEAEAGTRLLDLYEELYKYGYAFPGGTCPSVAVSGLVLGGGIGLSTRYLGLTTDSLLEVKMVNAEGKQLTANRCQNPKLFWALRGAGGGNYGVVTSYTFRLHKVNKITLIQLKWRNNLPARLEFLRVWQDWLKQLNPGISAFGKIYKHGAWMNSFYYGRPEEAQQLVEPFLRIPGITTQDIQYMDFIDAVKIIASEYPLREAFQATGRFVNRRLSLYELKGLIDIMDDAPDTADSLLSVYSMGGSVRSVDVDATAFFYRQSDYILGITSSWNKREEAPVHKAWVASGFNYIYDISIGSYVNFPYVDLPDYRHAYYGEHVRKLEAVKQKYDPCNLFCFPQCI